MVQFSILIASLSPKNGDPHAKQDSTKESNDSCKCLETHVEAKNGSTRVAISPLKDDLIN